MARRQTPSATFSRPARCRPSIAWLLLLLVYLAGTPAIGRWLIASLETTPPLDLQHPVQADAIVVLGAGIIRQSPDYGGDTINAAGLERLRYTARLYRATHLPVITSGGHPFGGSAEATVMATVLHDDFRIPVIRTETASRTTRENARDCRRILPADIHSIVLVTHAWHMPRAAWSFRQAGFVVIPAPTGYSGFHPKRWQDWLPQPAGWDNTAIACHEWLGIIWYHLLQWPIISRIAIQENQACKLASNG